MCTDRLRACAKTVKGFDFFFILILFSASADFPSCLEHQPVGHVQTPGNS